MCGGFSAYVNHEHVRFGNCVLQPGSSSSWRTDVSGRFVIATREGWTVDGEPLQRLLPVAVKPDHAEISNKSTSVGMAFTLAVSRRGAAVFFGSRARGTHRPDSDVDLFVIAPGCAYTGHLRGRVSLYVVSPDEAMRRARRGDLFLSSLLATGQVLFDPSGHIKELERAFVPSPQNAIVQEARAVGTLLLSNGFPETVPDVVARRALWCFRTLLMAEGQDPFREEYGSNTWLRETYDQLVAARSGDPACCRLAIAAFSRFMLEQGLMEPEWQHRSLEDWKERFQDASSRIGHDTLDLMIRLARHGA